MDNIYICINWSQETEIPWYETPGTIDGSRPDPAKSWNVRTPVAAPVSPMENPNLISTGIRDKHCNINFTVQNYHYYEPKCRTWCLSNANFNLNQPKYWQFNGTETQRGGTRWCESNVSTNPWAANASEYFCHSGHVDSAIRPLGYILHHVVNPFFVHILAVNVLLVNVVQVEDDDAQLQLKYWIVEQGGDEFRIVIEWLPDQFQCFPSHWLLELDINESVGVHHYDFVFLTEHYILVLPY